ncbi:MAG: glycosyltransferase [Candidatus Chisholmbacteria bacterium]|nr:glycosyltransferase [Candidatus Chisholmbacteria bacterium]
MKITLVIFTKNERRNCEKVYPRLPFSAVDKTFVIDGNSDDGTQEFWQAKNIPVLTQKYPGVGGAYESAFRHIKADGLIFFHPDGNMDPKDIPKFVDYLKQGENFIIASRNLPGAINEEDQFFFKPRKWFCQSLGLIARLFWGKGIRCTDVTQGFRALTKSAYQKLKIATPHPLAPDYEQVIRALKYEVSLAEFPTHEGKRLYGTSSMKSFPTGLANLKVLCRELFTHSPIT